MTRHDIDKRQQRRESDRIGCNKEDEADGSGESAPDTTDLAIDVALEHNRHCQAEDEEAVEEIGALAAVEDVKQEVKQRQSEQDADE